MLGNSFTASGGSDYGGGGNGKPDKQLGGIYLFPFLLYLLAFLLCFYVLFQSYCCSLSIVIVLYFNRTVHCPTENESECS